MTKDIASGQEKRASFRVSPPQHTIKEVALWFSPPQNGILLTTEQLGPPHTCSFNGADEVIIESLSSNGLCFSMVRHMLCGCPTSRCHNIYMYLKLRATLPGKHRMTCVFVGLDPLQAETIKDRVHVRAKITTKGIPAKDSKAFHLFDVKKSGVRELAIWCRDLDRMGRGILPPLTKGLDLEYLLMELNTPS